METEYCGYCMFNNVAIAAKHAVDNLGFKRYVHCTRPSINITVVVHGMALFYYRNELIFSSPEQKIPVSYSTTHGVSVCVDVRIHKC